MINVINIPEYEVSQFNKVIKEVVELNFDYVRIKGEISDLKNASSGHVYLTLKDDSSVLNATIWSQKKNYIKIKPEVGMEVIVTGKISTYAKSISTYSINIDNLELAGEGALLKLIEERKKKLQKQGIFDEAHKKEIPYLPKKIGVITSSTGAVIYDIINRIKDRCPVKIDIWPVSVQGSKAAEDIINAIRGFNNDKYIAKPEVIIIARGGGSTEDLMSFNEEEVAIAVYNSSIPIISAIGHETDTTIIDYCSDLRASTPTAAAEKVVPKRIELVQLVSSLSQRLNFLQENIFSNIQLELVNLSKFLKAPILIVNSYKEKINLVSENIFYKLENIFNINYNKLYNFKKLLRFPDKDIIDINKNLEILSKGINRNILDKKNSQQKELNKYSRLLESNSLHTNLKKGYSIIRKTTKIINKSKLINDNDLINVQFFDKSINIKIKKIN
jgi:exodeoxyribonuclease VII large subunit